MKKLCSFLGALSLSVFSATTAVACNGGLDMSINFSDEEKILSIQNLTEQQLVSSGVRINSLTSDEDIDKIIKALGLEELISNSPNGGVIKKSLGVYIMSNQFLNEVSSKVPGYAWIANKLTWQSQWSIKELVNNPTSSLNLFNNVSGWMKFKNKDWSLSVTFLDKDKLGWNGVEDPVYARININRKVLADENGSIDLENSNKEGIRGDYDENNPPNAQVTETDFFKGAIYQGYANSSSLFRLDEILSSSPSKVPPGIFNYSPSATDFVNNKIITLDFGNMILQNSKKEIEKALNDYLLNNPIYLGEGLKNSEINTIIKNQIYTVMLSQAIDRHNLKDESGTSLFTKDELNEADLLVESMINSLIQQVSKLLKSSWTNKTLMNNFLVMLNQIKNEDCEFNTISKTSFTDLFKEVMNDSRNVNDANSGQTDFSVGQLNTNLYKTGNNYDSLLSSQQDYFDFGFDSTYKFKVYYWSKSTPITGSEKQWYSPDDSRSPQDYISDKGFRNVFLGQRLSSSQRAYNVLEQYQFTQKNRIELDVLGIETTNLAPSKVNAETLMLNKLKEAIELDPNQVSQNINHDSWRIYHMAALLNKYADKKIYEIFGYDEKGNLEIHNKNVSLDFSKKSSSDFSKADDDIAFADLLKQKEINLITNDFQSKYDSPAREFIYRKGLGVTWNSSLSQFIFGGTINVFGKTLDTQDELNNIHSWWEQPARKYDGFLFRFKMTDDWAEYIDAYWKEYVSKNINNPDYNAQLEE
ncbi:hypothetical protein [Spiroplasma endosymbiont of Diplazon laetatorius]|uniref:hypothetical protein n=1 Tax=Spiroplasma endosymbiont of Diplazon laetatorius TaxID=3066322 RepID=UPI0030CF9608